MSRPAFEVADIVRAQGDRFLQQNRCWLDVHRLRVLRAIARCRMAELSGHIDTCSVCGYRAISYRRGWNIPGVLLNRIRGRRVGFPCVRKEDPADSGLKIEPAIERLKELLDA